MSRLCAWPGSLALLLLLGAGQAWPAPTAFFADGYHGGVYGHYPADFTRFIVDSLRAHPNWKINLEIEPETWDSVRTNEPEAYAEFKLLVADQSEAGRIEFVNPAYGQSYLWNISGESVLQQLTRGMDKIRQHFPTARFDTYSSEEPCFTSALPGILDSFGFKYAVLKNPNTCWGGYMRAEGGELVNWVGSDGSRILTVPRYGMEALRPGSTWETIANANSPAYVQAALAAQIQHPVGMCLQDAGWRFGPWLDHVGNVYQPSETTLWRNYFEHVADRNEARDWHFTQEDVQVSLVWGAQVLQRVAQQVRCAENRLVVAEKLATLAAVYGHESWPGATLDESWRTLLLSQHHDCWIVPYNERRHRTWADQVAAWTAGTCRGSDEVAARSLAALTGGENDGTACFIRVFNTLGEARTNVVAVTLPAGWRTNTVRITDGAQKELPWQPASEPSDPQPVIFRAASPAFGYSTYRLEKMTLRSLPAGPSVLETNGLVTLDTDLYRLVLDSRRGGTICSLVAKQLGGRELVDTNRTGCFDEIRGRFRESGRFLSSADQPAKIERLEVGPVRLRVRVSGQIGNQARTQTITLVEGEPRIDFSVRIEWRGRPGIGADEASAGGIRREDDYKAFYDDRAKLRVLFPLNLSGERIFKDAPFDVATSSLADTYFDRWSAIKNNVILNWVDAFDPGRQVGVGLLTDHTTSYSHDSDHTLGLTLQYSGAGLWGRDYALDGATEVHYALLPHGGDWQQADLWNAARCWNEPLVAKVFWSGQTAVQPERSLLQIDDGGWEVPTARAGADGVLLRLFNPAAQASTKILRYGRPVAKVELMQLNGQIQREIPCHKEGEVTVFKVALPPFGIGTLRLTP